jgi:quinol-cytochrome oxidoreductase complex cytochrome b subunit
MKEESEGFSLTRWIEKRFNLTEMFSFLTNFGIFPAELDTSLPLREAIDDALRHPMPSYARWPRVLGLLSVLLFAFLAITGLMLAFYYQPAPTEAYESVTIIVRDVSFGWFVHQIHGWAADAFLLILLLRGWRFYFQGLYKPPREALWIVAIVTFLAATHADLTGRLLGWDAQGYWNAVRAVDMLYSLPVLGPLRGPLESPRGEPFRAQGLPRVPVQRADPDGPDLRDPRDPCHGRSRRLREGRRSVQHAPRGPGALVPAGVARLPGVVPVLRRSRGRTARQRRLANAVGLLVLLGWLLFTWIGYRMEVSP